MFLPNRARAKAGPEPGHPRVMLGFLGTRTEQKAAASGALVLYVDPRFTSQECRICGHIAPGNRESQAMFRW